MDYEKNETRDSVILIVDDVEMNRAILEEIIKDMRAGGKRCAGPGGI